MFGVMQGWTRVKDKVSYTSDVQSITPQMFVTYAFVDIGCFYVEKDFLLFLG